MNDLSYYARTHLRIRTKEAQLVPLRLNFPQKVTLEKLSKQLRETGRIRAVILKARQEGISTLTAARFFRKIHLWPNQRATVVAHERDKSSAIFEFYDRMYKNLIDEVKVPKLSSQKGNVLHLANDSQIVVETAMDEDAGASTTIQLLHASEVARWPNAETVFVSLANTVPDTASEVIIESTAKGVGNFFHQCWEDAEAGRSGYQAIFLPWWIHPEYELPVSEDEQEEIKASHDPYEREAQDEGFLWEGKRHKLSVRKLMWRRRIGIPEKCAGNLRKFHEEYPSTADEAFVASGETFFDKDALEIYKKRTEVPTRRRITLSRKGTIVAPLDPLGHLRVWELPTRDGLYAIGADCASGKLVTSDPDDERGGRDFSCAQVYDCKNKKLVAQLHGRMPPEVFSQQLVWLGHFYNTAKLGPERNHSSGETVVQKVYDELGYPNVYVARQVNTRSDGRVTSRWGWWTTKVTRPIMLDELSEVIRNLGVKIPDTETIKEGFTFIVDDRGVPVATEGCHDDRIMALAITLQVAQTQKEPPKGELPKAQEYASVSGAFDYGWD
jgi:hypothetical protein